MITSLANLVRWEWFKLGRRWMPWILLAMLLLLSQLFVWGGFFSYRNMPATAGDIALTLGTGVPGERGTGTVVRVTCNDLLAGQVTDLPKDIDPGLVEQLRQRCKQAAEQQETRLREAYASFTLPGSIPGAMGVAQSIGLILIAILAASIVGTEYGWGTLRTVLARGTVRWQYLAAKLALLMLVAAAALLVVLAVTGISSLAAGALAGGAPSGTAPAVGWADAFAALGRAWVALLPYVALAAFITVLTRSSAAGMAVALGYFFAEQIAVSILISVFDWFGTVADYVLGRNITAWMLGSQRDGLGGATVGAGVRIGEYPGELHGLLVLVAYTLVLAGVAFWLFQRKDIPGASGG
ncbi:MAG: ABC transporter permease subunit [Chloroflexi bacterium]|nr:ABC transporter permease subunit [Chloroflexota bacterium]